MQTQAFVKVDSLSCIGVASFAATFVTVNHANWRAIVAGGDDSLVFDYYAADAPFHAVAAGGAEVGHPHEVGGEVGAD